MIKRHFKICSLLLPLFLYVCALFFNFLNRFYFLEQFSAHSKIEQKVQRFPLNFLLQLTHTLALSTFSTRVLEL